MPEANEETRALREAIKQDSNSLFWIGISTTILGVLAIVFPYVFSAAANFMVGWILLLAGILTVLLSFWVHGTGPFFGVLLSGLLTLAAGVYLLTNPAQGMVILTVMVAIVFMFQGAFSVMMAFDLRPEAGWGWFLFSGAVSVIVGLMIVANLPGTSTVILGLVIGVNFLTSGIGMIMVSRAVKDIVDA